MNVWFENMLENYFQLNFGIFMVEIFAFLCVIKYLWLINSEKLYSFWLHENNIYSNLYLYMANSVHLLELFELQ